MFSTLHRICWNTNGWQHPSGAAINDSGFAEEYGFGHEEWNFRRQHAYKKMIYGYVRKPPVANKIPEGTWNLNFYTIDPKTAEKYWVGVYSNAARIDDSEYDALYTFFEGQGIFQQRERELTDNVQVWRLRTSPYDEVRDSVREPYIKVKCNVKDAILFESPKPLQELIDTKSHRYRFNAYSIITAKKVNTLKAASKTLRPDPLAEEEYYRDSPALRRKVIPLHNRLSNRFRSWLGKEGIDADQEKEWIDINFEYNGKRFLVELKICYDINQRKAIREALGQIIEYNYYSGRSRFDRWLIVLDVKPKAEEIAYIDVLRTKLRLPIVLGWEHRKKFEFHPSWVSR
jgi:hypothetical protein